jgi:hypothetical protein
LTIAESIKKRLAQPIGTETFLISSIENNQRSAVSEIHLENIGIITLITRQQTSHRENNVVVVDVALDMAIAAFVETLIKTRFAGKLVDLLDKISLRNFCHLISSYYLD